MSQNGLDAIGDEIRESCKKEGMANFSIERAYLIGEEMRDSRRAKLATIVDPKNTDGEPFDLLLLFDVIAAAASVEAACVSGPRDASPVSSEVIDLWIRATAARALWSERFIQWPSENSSKKIEHLRATARKLGAESIARALVEGVQPVKFTQFVARFSRL